MSEENTTQEIKLYELGYHLIPSITEDELSSKVDELKKVLSDNGAEIVKEGQPKMMELSYEIIKNIAGKNHKFTNSYFGWIKFNASAEGIEKIRESIALMDFVLRNLVTKTVDDDEHSTSKIDNKEEEAEFETETEPESKSEPETEPEPEPESEANDETSTEADEKKEEKPEAEETEDTEK